MAESRRAIEFDIEVQGAESAASALGSVNRELDETARTSGVASRQIQVTGQAVEQGGRKWGELAGAIGNVGSVASTTNPALAEMGGIIGAVGSASSALTGAMGPLGVAIAAVTTAYGIYQVAAASAREETESLATAAENARTRIQELMTALRESDEEGSAATGVSGVDAARARVRELELERRALRVNAQEAHRFFEIRGMNEEAELEAFQRQRANNQDLGNRTESHTEALETLLMVRERDLEITRQLTEANEGLARAQEAERAAAAGQEDIDETVANAGSQNTRRDAARTRRARGASAAAAARERAEEEARLARVAAKERANEVVLQEEQMAAQLQQIRAELAQWTADLDQQQLDERKRVLREMEQAEIQKIEAQKAAEESRIAELRRQEQEEMERIKSESMPILQSVVGGLTDALANVIAGSKSADEAFQGLLSSFLEMISQQAALEAAKEFASAIASFASQDYSGGALHLAAGAAWTGVAIAAGAASIAVAPPAESAPASPQASGSGGDGGGSSYTFNINGPVLSSGSRANLGRELGGIIGEGQRRFGRTG